MSGLNISAEAKEIFALYKEAFDNIQEMLRGCYLGEIFDNLEEQIESLLGNPETHELKLRVLLTYLDKVIARVTDEFEEEEDQEDLFSSLYPIFDAIDTAIKSDEYKKCSVAYRKR